MRVLDTLSDPIDRILGQRGLRRTTVLTVPHFSAAPHVIARTGCIATLSRRLAEGFADPRLSVRSAPIEMNARPLRMIWHQRTDADEGARVLRALLQEAVLR